MTSWKHLDPPAFRGALDRGLGRCVLHLREGGDPTPHREALLDTFRHNRAYDPQCEGTRVTYLVDLAEAASMLDELYDAALGALSTCDERWDADQHAAVALAFARDGDRPAAHALRARLDELPPGHPVFDSIAWAVLQLDGITGLLRALRRLGSDPSAEARTGSGSYLCAVASDTLGEQTVKDALAAVDDGVVAAQLDAIRDFDDRFSRAPASRKPLTLDGLIEEARAHAAKGARYMGHGAWAKQASEDDLRAASDRLAAAREPWLQGLLLRVFLRAPYPGPLGALLALAAADDEKVRDEALRVLSHIEAPEVRALVWSSLAGNPPSWGAIRLLDANYEPGDGRRVASLLEQVPDEIHLIHSIGFDLFEAFKGERRGDDVIEPFAWLYEHTPCSRCRNDAVAALDDHGALRGAIADECAWDCCDETRELVQQGDDPRPG
jgi:hypothetical protein